jgi:hypothetical protein
MNWRQAPGQRVREYAQYIEDHLHFNCEQIDHQGVRFNPKSKSHWLNQGLCEDVYQVVPEWIWNSDFSWQDKVDSAEDAEWLIDLYRHKSRIGQYENRRYYKNRFSFDRDGYVIVYTDGSCLGNGKYYARGGIGVWFGHGHEW